MDVPLAPTRTEIDRVIDAAFAEDFGERGDVTSLALIPADRIATFTLVAREPALLAGLDVFARVFARLDPEARIEALTADGFPLSPDQPVAHVRGRTRALLGGERTALNLIQRLSGVATATSRYVAAIAGIRPGGVQPRVLATRKTTPGLRALERYAVLVGGAADHRRGLHDMILIKDNHVDAVGSIGEAIARARAAATGLAIEVEVRDEMEFREAVAAAPDRIMFDNFAPEAIRALAPRQYGIETEASGRVTLENVRDYAATGVDFISVGALTHSVKAIDLGLKWAAR